MDQRTQAELAAIGARVVARQQRQADKHTQFRLVADQLIDYLLAWAALDGDDTLTVWRRTPCWFGSRYGQVRPIVSHPA